jgi:hypothetical protein
MPSRSAGVNASDHIDLFTKAAEHEQKIGAQQKECAKAHIFAQAPAQSISTRTEDPRRPAPEQAIAYVPF